MLGQPLAVRPVRRHRVKAIDDRENSRANRDRLSRKTGGISGSIPILVVMAHDGDDGIGEADRRQNVGADIGMPLHRLELDRRQCARLVQNVLRYRELPDVVQQRRSLERTQLPGIADPERVRQLHRELLHAPDVPVRHLVLGIDCLRERLDCRQVHAVHLIQMSDAVLHAPHRMPEGGIDDQRDRREQQQHGQVRVPLLHQHDKLRRDRCAAEIRQPEREEDLAEHA